MSSNGKSSALPAMNIALTPVVSSHQYQFQAGKHQNLTEAIVLVGPLSTRYIQGKQEEVTMSSMAPLNSKWEIFSFGLQ